MKKSKVRGRETKLTKAEEELAERYGVLFTFSKDAIITLEPPSWKFTSGNFAAIKMFNIKYEKNLTSLGLSNLSPKKQPDGQLSSIKIKKMIEKAVKEGGVFFEWTHKRYKGKNFPATILFSRVKEGGKTYLQATIRDISEQKNEQEDLKKSEEKYRGLFENATDAIFIADPKTKKLIDCNKDAEKLTGYPKNIILSMKADDLHPKDKVKETMEAFKKQVQGKSTLYVTEVLTKDKKRIPVSINASTVHLNDKEYIQGIFRDISEQKNSQKKMEIFNEAAIGRELKMIELKKRIKELENKLKGKKS